MTLLVHKRKIVTLLNLKLLGITNYLKYKNITRVEQVTYNNKTYEKVYIKYRYEDTMTRSQDETSYKKR